MKKLMIIMSLALLSSGLYGAQTGILTPTDLTTIRGVIREEIEGYFAGQKTAEEKQAAELAPIEGQLLIGALQQDIASLKENINSEKNNLIKKIGEKIEKSIRIIGGRSYNFSISLGYDYFKTIVDPIVKLAIAEQRKLPGKAYERLNEDLKRQFERLNEELMMTIEQTIRTIVDDEKLSKEEKLQRSAEAIDAYMK
jgi:protein-arginine kinase activator protein McsA